MRPPRKLYVVFWPNGLHDSFEAFTSLHSAETVGAGNNKVRTYTLEPKPKKGRKR